MKNISGPAAVTQSPSTAHPLTVEQSAMSCCWRQPQLPKISKLKADEQQQTRGVLLAVKQNQQQQNPKKNPLMTSWRSKRRMIQLSRILTLKFPSQTGSRCHASSSRRQWQAGVGGPLLEQEQTPNSSRHRLLLCATPDWQLAAAGASVCWMTATVR
jgi:hypothetical protein